MIGPTTEARHPSSAPTSPGARPSAARCVRDEPQDDTVSTLFGSGSVAAHRALGVGRRARAHDGAERPMLFGRGATDRTKADSPLGDLAAAARFRIWRGNVSVAKSTTALTKTRRVLDGRAFSSTNRCARKVHESGPPCRRATRSCRRSAPFTAGAGESVSTGKSASFAALLPKAIGARCGRRGSRRTSPSWP